MKPWVMKEIWESFEWLLKSDLENNDIWKFENRIDAMWSDMMVAGAGINNANEFLKEKFRELGYDYKPRGRKKHGNRKNRITNRECVGA